MILLNLIPARFWGQDQSELGIGQRDDITFQSVLATIGPCGIETFEKGDNIFADLSGASHEGIACVGFRELVTGYLYCYFPVWVSNYGFR